jgi:hypothetical protein
MPSSTTTARIIIANHGKSFDGRPGVVEPGLFVLEPGGRSVLALGFVPLVGTGLGTTPLARGMTIVGTPSGEEAVACAAGALTDEAEVKEACVEADVGRVAPTPNARAKTSTKAAAARTR